MSPPDFGDFDGARIRESGGGDGADLSSAESFSEARIPGAGSPVRKNRNEEVLSARRTPGAMMRHRSLCPAAKRRIYCGFTQV